MDKSILLEDFTSIGINHRVADVAMRERFSLTREKQLEMLRDAMSQGISSLLIVSTCNRTEVLARTSDATLLSILLISHCDASMDDFRQYGFIKHGEAALDHFFRVSTGLDSQILGDLQIIKQVKEAYNTSIEAGMADSVMHRLMQSINRTHKRSRNETSLGSGAASTAYAAVQMAKNNFGTFREKKVLLIGAGKIGKVTCKNLLSMGASDVTVINRSFDRAESLGGKFSIRVSTIEKIDIELARADLAIVATGAEKPVVTAEHFELSDPDGNTKLLIDLSVPRNVSPDVEKLPFVKLINMDMLSDKLDETFRAREANIPLVENIIKEELDVFCEWLSQLSVVPTIRALNEKFDQIRKSELERYKNKLSEDTLSHIDMLTRRIVNKIVAHSIEHIKENKDREEEVTRIIRDMYKIESGLKD
jgi:glutamyl-tRNA reductase